MSKDSFSSLGTQWSDAPHGKNSRGVRLFGPAGYVVFSLAFFAFAALFIALAFVFNQVLFGVISVVMLAFIAVTFFVLPRLKSRNIGPHSLTKSFTSLVNAYPCPAILMDAHKAVICANQAYGVLFNGYPSPHRLPVEYHEGQARKTIHAPDGADWSIQTIALEQKAGVLWLFHPTIVDEERSPDVDVTDYFDAVGFGAARFDDNNVLTHINDHLSQWLGGSSSQFIGSGFDAIFSVRDGDKVIFDAEGQDPVLLHVKEMRLDQQNDGQIYVFEQPNQIATDFISEEDVAAIPDQLFDHAPAGIALVDDKGQVRRCNEPLRRFLDIDHMSDFVIFDALEEADREVAQKLYADALFGQNTQAPVEVRFTASKGRVAQLYVRGLKRGAGAVFYLIDMTDQKQLELQFTQAQKMQAVGQLAGGIAHDFNNILTAIIGFCDLLLVRHGAGDASFSDIMQIKQNANRAANLVRQLLAFSRQQTLRPSVLLVTDVLAELSNLLRRLIGENIEMNMVHGREIGLVKVDQGQLEQVIINLAVNARDAMVNGGVLNISTYGVKAFDVNALGHSFMPAQDYVALEVEDTGHGIPENLLTKIFDPFFTTKEMGKGTGLGLSTVYGIVKQTGGFIFADNCEGEGARFTIYLPVHHVREEEAKPTLKSSAKPMTEVADLWGHGTILLVEDEDAVRTFAYRALVKKGYSVLQADSGEAALEAVQNHDGEINLIISDVIMPNMDGPTLVEKLKDLAPDARVIFISGYAQDSFRNNFDADNYHFLPKPFSLAQLAEKVKIVMSDEM